jgi:putative peptidoglycan lipid II flippase
LRFYPCFDLRHPDLRKYVLLTLPLMLGLTRRMTPTIYRKVGLASLVMMASVFLSRVIGLLREMVIAHFGGAGQGVDAYQVAFIVPEILNHIVASGFLSVTFIPIFSRYLVRNEEAEGWRVFSIVLIGFGTLLLVFSAVAFWAAPRIIALVAPGRTDPLFQAEAVRMARIIIPAQLFFFAGGLLMAVQFAKEKFAIPALAPLVYNLGIILGGVCLGPRLGMEGFSWGVLIGAFAGNLLIQYYGARKVGLRFYPCFDLRHPDLRKYVLLTLPLMLGLTMTFSTELFFKLFGSFLPEGGIAALNYALRTMLILVAVFGQAVGTASFPFMARLASQERIDEMNRLLNTTLRHLALVIPFSILLMVLRYETVRILFQRGRFDAAATQMTAQALVYMMVGAFAFAAQTLVVRGYYATQNTLFPAIYGTLAVLLSVPLYYVGLQEMGIRGVALALAVSAVFQTTLLYVLWTRRTGNPGSRGVYRFFLQVAAGSAVLGIFLEWFRSVALAGLDRATLGGCLLSAALTGTVFTVILLGAGYGLRIPEITGLVEKVFRRGLGR